MNSTETAKKVASKILERDKTCRSMGICLEYVNEGTATLSLKIKQQHINGHGICHGGIIFTLSDSAFAFACNSRNVASVAQHANVTANQTLYVVHHLVIDWERLKLSFPSKESGFSQINYCLEGILDPLL